MPPLTVTLAQLVSEIDADLPTGDALGKVGEARERARDLTDLADQLVDHYVSQARATGASWSQIGDAMGVSKQAAQQRAGAAQFSRFTDRARNVVVAAQERAREMRHDRIGTEHLLLGVLDEAEGLGAKVVATLGASLTELAESVRAAAPVGDTEPAAQIPLSPDAKNALQESTSAALELGHNYVGTEHLLLGLLRVPEATAARLLQAADVDYSRARDAVVAALVGFQHRVNLKD